jgi:hypothetical protein
MKITFVILLTFSFIAFPLVGQTPSPSEQESPLFDLLFADKGSAAGVRIVQEAKLDEVLLAFMEQNRKLNGIPCYWIRIYSGSTHDAREKAYEIKAQFLRKYEGIRNDVIYDDPNFKVYVGGYRSKSETLKLLNQIKKDFRTAFIVYDIIDFPEK